MQYILKGAKCTFSENSFLYSWIIIFCGIENYIIIRDEINCEI